MPIPAFDDRGLLPAGIYDCTLAEVKTRFGMFQGSDRRPKLFAKLETFVSELKRAAIATSIIVDGSFVTAQPKPNDIDLILVVRIGHDFSSDLSLREYDLLSKHRVHRRFGFDLLVAPDNSGQLKRYIRFFEQIRLEPGRFKGILKLTL